MNGALAANNEKWISLGEFGSGRLMLHQQNLEFGEDPDTRGITLAAEVMFEGKEASRSTAIIVGDQCMNTWSGEIVVQPIDGSNPGRYYWKKDGEADFDAIGTYLCAILHRTVKQFSDGNLKLHK
jgi:hypothetical protein